jgi:hypothetical protein
VLGRSGGVMDLDPGDSTGFENDSCGKKIEDRVGCTSSC